VHSIKTGLADGKIKALWARQGARVELESRADFAGFVAEEAGRWRRLVKAARLQLE